MGTHLLGLCIGVFFGAFLIQFFDIIPTFGQCFLVMQLLLKVEKKLPTERIVLVFPHINSHGSCFIGVVLAESVSEAIYDGGFPDTPRSEDPKRERWFQLGDSSSQQIHIGTVIEPVLLTKIG